ncbi:FAH family protein, partial [human gut metagenome]
GELVIIIGKSGKNISPEKAMEHILGYTIGNDVSARTLQFRGSQWILGKSLDHFAPIGPNIVSPDDFDFES